MRAVILCGGRGIRAWPATVDVPKPMLRVGERPMLEHVMEVFARQGVTDFVLATGYKGDVIASWAAGLEHPWSVVCVDTGQATDTGDRLRQCAAHLDSVFFATYGDGLGNVDLDALRRRHEAHGGTATVTVVRLPSPYGTIDADDTGRVVAFREKPVLDDHWINAGFFVFEPAALTSTPGPSLERDVLPALSDAGRLYVYRHDGFWTSMDSYKDIEELNRLAREEGHLWLDLPSTPSTVSGAPASSSPAPRGSSART